MALRGESWTPPRMRMRDLSALLGFLVGFAFVRGFDFATGSDRPAAAGDTPPPPSSLTVLENAFPLWGWALAYIIGAALLGAGALLARHVLVYVGHGVLWAAYGLTGLSAVASSFEKPWWDGIRGSGPLFIVAVVHFILWLRTGPVPAGETA